MSFVRLVYLSFGTFEGIVTPLILKHLIYSETLIVTEYTDLHFVSISKG